MDNKNTNSQGSTQLREKRSCVTLKTLSNIKNMIRTEKNAQEISESLCLSTKATYNWTDKLSFLTTDQNYQPALNICCLKKYGDYKKTTYKNSKAKNEAQSLA
ncbi:hypothetical protein MXB_2571 [Myxobolus squamalis]|nr:hypothetical protein MXB_2571 [Myxobolus squamalis]